MLLPINQVLNKTSVQKFRKLLDNATWQDGRLTAGSQAVHVKSNHQLDDQSELALKMGDAILQALGTVPEFMSAALPKKIFPPKFNRYSQYEYYGPHVDNAIMNLPDNQTLRTDLSATLFLTEPEAYEGGELMIETRYGVQEVKLNAGDMILYPSTSLHHVNPVTKGTRVCVFFWIESMVRDCQQREMLFDLDQSIQILTTELGSNNTEVKRLTGLYHNLVRLWAST